MKNQLYVLILIVAIVILITMATWNNNHESFGKTPGKVECSTGFKLGCIHHCMGEGGNEDECYWKCEVGDYCKYLGKGGKAGVCADACYPSI